MQSMNLSGVERVTEYKGNRADIAIICNGADGVRQVRHYFLKNLRDTHEWVDSHSNDESGSVQLKVKS